LAVESIHLQTPLRLGLLALLLGSLIACSEQSAPAGNETTAAEPSLASAADPSAASTGAATVAAEQLSAERMAQWTRNCALCHVRGEGGAPVLGDREAWAERREKGEDVLLQNTVAGLNNMPPLGYCMDCEADDFLALIRFMGGER
jgi:cytochrome c5